MSEFTISKIAETSVPQRTYSNPAEWQERIKQTQLQRATPEVLDRIKQNAERYSRATKSLQAVNRIERVNYLQTMTNTTTLREYSVLSESRRGEKSEGIMRAANSHTARSKKLMSLLQPKQKETTQVQDTTLAAPASVTVSTTGAYDFDMADEEELQTLEVELGAIQPLAVSSAGPLDLNSAQVSAAQDIDQLLSQFNVEPSDPSELTAKFLLYENFLETVTTIRNTTITFWEESRDQFSASARISQQKSVDMIDSQEYLAIPDHGSKWFVYYMTMQANNNSKNISNVLSGIKSKLNILSQELGECPFCLDQLTAETVVTLSCCHRTCKDCWDNWSSIKGARVFCPLCNHNEFLGEIVSG